MIFTPTEIIYILKAALKTRKSKESTVDQAMSQLNTGPWRKPWSLYGGENICLQLYSCQRRKKVWCSFHEFFILKQREFSRFQKEINLVLHESTFS